MKLRFKRVAQTLTNQIQTIEDTTLLSTLFQKAVLSDSLKTFKQVMEEQNKSAEG